jgi:hypothetical protein
MALPLSLTTLAPSASCATPPHMGQPVAAALAPAMATDALLHGRHHGPLPLCILMPSSCHQHLCRAMPHAQRFFLDPNHHQRPLPSLPPAAVAVLPRAASRRAG